MLTSYLNRQLTEIRTQPGLALYGALLSLSHFVTFLFWNRNNYFVSSQSAKNAEPLCFPFFPNCDLWREQFSPEFWQNTLYAYFALAIVSGLLFLNKKWVSVAWWSFAGLTLLKLALVSTNYAFTDSHHLMILIVSTLFLFASSKEKSIAVFVVTFYVLAGLSKLNFHWLSGATMISVELISPLLLPWALMYVPLLEILGVLGLFHPSRWIRFLVLSQLVLIHLISWPMVGFHNACLAICILSLFVLCPANAYRSPWQSLSPKILGVLCALWFLFLGLQTLPLANPHHSPVGGIYRLWSLNIVEPASRCKSVLMVEMNKQTLHHEAPRKNLGRFFRCDPIVHLNQLHQLCRDLKLQDKVWPVHFTLHTRTTTQSKFKTVIDMKNACQYGNPLWAERLSLEDS